MKQKVNKIIVVAMILMLGAFPAFADIVFCGKKSLDDPTTPGVIEGACTFQDMFRLVYLVINFLISGAGLVAIFFIVLGGAQMLLSAGNEARVKEAKDTIKYALLGLTLVLLSYLIIGFVVGLFIPGSSDPIRSLIELLQ